MSRNYDAWRAAGIVPIVRPVAPESEPYVASLKAAIGESALGRGARLREQPSAVPVVCYSNFYTHNEDLAIPPTTDIMPSVPTLELAADVPVARLGVFGSDSRLKICAVFAPQPLRQEFASIESAYREHMITLRTPHGLPFLPRLTLADYRSFERQKTIRQLRRLGNELQGQGFFDQLVALEPARADELLQ